MSIEIQIPVALARYAENQESLTLEGNSVKQALGSLTTKYPTPKNHLFGIDGKLRHFVNVYVNDENIKHGEELATPLKSGDVVTIVPSIAGGR